MLSPRSGSALRMCSADAAPWRALGHRTTPKQSQKLHLIRQNSSGSSTWAPLAVAAVRGTRRANLWLAAVVCVCPVCADAVCADAGCGAMQIQYKLNERLLAVSRSKRPLAFTDVGDLTGPGNTVHMPSATASSPQARPCPTPTLPRQPHHGRSNLMWTQSTRFHLMHGRSQPTSHGIPACVTSSRCTNVS